MIARHQADEAVQRQRRPHLALPERPGVVRPRAIATASMCMDEANIECHHYGNDVHNRLTNDPAWQAAYPRPRRAHGGARQEPPVGRHLVDGQRVGRRPQRRRDVSSGRSSATPRGRSTTRARPPRRLERRHQLVHVSAPQSVVAGCAAKRPDDAARSSASTRTRWATATAASRSTGTSSTRAPTRRAPSSGTGWTRASGSPFPASTRPTRRAPRFLAYGGWWEDKIGVRNDNNFNNNGLVAADRTPHPGLYAIKYVYRYLHASPGDLAAGKIRVKNWFDSSPMPKDIAEGAWEVKADGKIDRGADAAGARHRARAEKEFTLALPRSRPSPASNTG